MREEQAGERPSDRRHTPERDSEDTLDAMRPWRPEVVMNADLAARLIGQFPELTVGSLRPLAEGWDRALWLLNERWLFGFPKRALVVPGIEREMALLPVLTPLLALPAPTPTFLGRPADGYPWPFFGSAFLPGREVCDVALGEGARLKVALAVAGFLKRLHSQEIDEAVSADALPVDPNERVDMTKRVPLARRQLAEVEGLGSWAMERAVERLLDEAETLPPTAQPLRVVHGDLHFRHVLVHQGKASGIIDWIDLCRADPAIDLQLVWSFLRAPARRAFLDAYGPVTQEQLLRARVLAFSLSAALAIYGHEEGMTAVEREALSGLQRAAAN